VVVLVVEPPPRLVDEVVLTAVLVVVELTGVHALRLPTWFMLFVGLGAASAKLLSNAAPPARVRLCAPVLGVLATGGDEVAPE
jgi:hypothetical protein